MFRRAMVTAASAALLTASASAQWVELGDAPEGVPGHQDTVGIGPLSSISGVLNRPTADHTDTYCIEVTDPQAFFATTKQFFGGSATTQTGGNGDTRLWLWNLDGTPLLANDDVNTASLGSDGLASFVSDPSTFPTFTGGELVHSSAAGASITVGSYLLSISEFSNDPDDSLGADLVSLGVDFDALHGANLSAGAFDHWENAADSTTITYNIALAGATFCTVPEPGSLGLLGGAALLAFGRRRSA